MGIQILYFFLFVIELSLSLIIIFALIIADEIVLQKQELFEEEVKEIVGAIREIRGSLSTINKFFSFFKEEKIKIIKKIIEKALTFIDILMIFAPSGKSKIEFGKRTGLKIAKSLLLGLKMMDA